MSRRVLATTLAAATAFAVLCVALVAAAPPGPSPHRPDAPCSGCHTADAATLARDPVAARGLLVPDLEARCDVCHADQGPSHKTGMPPAHPVPSTLPLSATGTITCGTCHFLHGENDRFGDYVRIDNRHGGLCLTCHTLSELE